MIIQIENLSYEYENMEGQGKIVAINDISINIEKGSFVAILGKNGSGKSTLAKNINGLLTPTKGTILVNGYDTQNEEFIWDIRQSTGMVFQNPDSQIVSSIVEDDVAFGPENIGVSPEEIRIRVDNALANVGMYEYRQKSPHQLSGGQKQRIAIAGIIAMKPDCIIMDEPTAMLDPQGRKDVIAIAQKLNQEGITIIIVTHFMEEALLADRVIVIDEGKVVIDGEPKDIFTNMDKLEKMNLEAPLIVRLCYKLRQRGIMIPENIISEKDFVKWVSK